jgi:hypothetical protein
MRRKADRSRSADSRKGLASSLVHGTSLRLRCLGNLYELSDVALDQFLAHPRDPVT